MHSTLPECHKLWGWHLHPVLQLKQIPLHENARDFLATSLLPREKKTQIKSVLE
jgi:hypothetical protein